MTKVMDRITFSHRASKPLYLHGFDPVTKTPIVIAVVAPEHSVLVPPATNWQAISTGRIVAQGDDMDSCLAALDAWIEGEGFAQPA